MVLARTRLSVGGMSLGQRDGVRNHLAEVREVTRYPLPGDPPRFHLGYGAKSDYPRKSSFQYTFLPWTMYQSTFHISLPRTRVDALCLGFSALSGAEC